MILKFLIGDICGKINYCHTGYNESSDIIATKLHSKNNDLAGTKGFDYVANCKFGYIIQKITRFLGNVCSNMFYSMRYMNSRYLNDLIFNPLVPGIP